MKCKHCGQEIADDSMFCEYCGTKTNNELSAEKRASGWQKFGSFMIPLLGLIWYGTKIREEPLVAKSCLKWGIIGFVFGIVLNVIVVLMESNVYNSNNYTEVPVIEEEGLAQEWVDLGLLSGTLWKNSNEEGGFYTYDEAVNEFGGKLPTDAQVEELRSKCQWEWMGNGYNVKGANGNKIFLPAAGYRNCDGSVDYVGSVGGYWSSIPSGSDNAWDLDFNSGEVYVGSNFRCYGLSVRLVQD